MRRSTGMIRTLLRVAVATGGCLVVGQEAGVSPMKVRLLEWRDAVEKETRGLREQYAQVLAKAEKELAAKRAYGAAAKVRAERGSLGVAMGGGAGEGKKRPSADASAGSGVTLLAEQAEAVGGVVLSKREGDGKGILSGWVAPGSKVRWKLPAGMSGGGYEVELTFSGVEGSGGRIEVKEGYYWLGADVGAGSGWDELRTEVVGTLRVLADSPVLELSMAALKGGELFRLRSLRLIPVGTVP